MGIVLESMIVIGQRSNSDNEYENPSALDNSDDDRGTIAAFRRPTGSFNGRFKKVLKVKKEKNQPETLPVAGKQLYRSRNSEDSVSASSNKNSFTVSSYDDDIEDYFSRRRARFLFRQRVGK